MPDQQPLFRDAPEDTRAACIRIARRLRLAHSTVIGLIPAGRVPVTPVATLLAGALIELSGARVAMSTPGGPSTSAPADGPPFESTWKAEKLAAITPARTPRPGDIAAGLTDVIQHCRGHFTHLVVDLTVFCRLGEVASVVSQVDAAAALVRAKKTRERELVRLASDLIALKEDRFVGVICC